MVTTTLARSIRLTEIFLSTFATSMHAVDHPESYEKIAGLVAGVLYIVLVSIQALLEQLNKENGDGEEEQDEEESKRADATAL